MRSSRRPRTREQAGRASIGLLIAVALLSGAVCASVAWLLLNIQERKLEGAQPVFRVAELDEESVDPAVWGQSYPLHYDDYLKTADMQRTRFGGSESVPHEPTPDDPRPFFAKSKLVTIPQLERMWAGYAFAKDYRAKRGHAYMLEDQVYTERQSVGQPGTCIHCHASTYGPMRWLGDGDLQLGFEKLNEMSYWQAKELHHGPIGCIDCHDPETMNLRITRPAFMEAIAKVKALEGIADYDVNAMATRQELRSYVCGQCHVEYYFRVDGDRRTLAFPWDAGLRVDDAWAHYEASGFEDWVHAETGAPMLKAQHPEFEMWSQGIHARSGVACADCHMPYRRVGGQKISNHQVRSPMLRANEACGTCHKIPDAELVARVENIQERHVVLVERALDALVDLIDELSTARARGVDPARLNEAQQLQRRASFYVDWVEAENSSGFHAPQEAARTLAEAIDYARRGQLALREGGLPSADVSSTAASPGHRAAP